jgi:ankyrin repeat protein
MTSIDPGRTPQASLGTRCSIAAASAALALVATLVAATPAVAITDAELATNARLLASARNDDAPGVVRALHDGAAVDSRNRLGETGLLIALKKDRADMAQALLAAGADVNLPAINGVTPLMAAA